MNSVKKSTYKLTVNGIAIFILLIFPCLVHSQVRQEKAYEKPRLCEEKAKDETMWMIKNLYLNADQYGKVQSLNLYYSCLLESLTHLSDKWAISKKKTELLKNKDAEFRAVLSEQQYEQYKTHKEKKIEQKKSPFSSHV